jgi:hypothetical protein
VVLASKQSKEDTMTTVSRPVNRLPAVTALSSITSKLQKILLVEVLVFLGNSAAAVALIIATYGMATEDHFTGTTLVSGYLADGIPAVLFAVAAALTASVAVRIWKMLDAAGRGDVAALTRLSSPGWAVIAMIASWVIPGRMLQQVNGAIRGLGSESQ